MQRSKIKKIPPLEVPYKSFLEEEVDNEELLSKFLSGHPYNGKNMKKASEFLMNRSKFEYEHQFRIFENVTDLVKKFQIQENEGPLFVICGKSINIWVVFCVIWKETGQTTVVYKDSSGASIPFDIEQTIRKFLPDTEYVICQTKDQKDDDEFLYGPLCLRNLQILLQFFENNPDDSPEAFLKILFSRAADINQQKLTTVISLTFSLSKNDDFKAYLKSFIKKLPRQLAADVADLHKILREELEKDEQDVNLDRIEEARRRCLKEEDIKRFSEDFKVHMNEKAQEYELENAKDFTKEMKRMRQIFQILNTCKDDQGFQEAQETVHTLLGVTDDEIKSLGQHLEDEDDEETQDRLLPEDIADLLDNVAEGDQNNDVHCTPIEELWPQINFNMDQDPSEESEEDLENLKDKFHQVGKFYAEYEDADLVAINKWAKSKKGRLGTSDDAVCEAVAVMDRAVNLLKSGRRLRSTQISSVLIFFRQTKQGQLCQIQTGEGKTVIVCLLATIRALQGSTVDVITSSPVLALEAVNENKNFYSTFGLTVACNNYGQTKNCYTADVLYGCISSFQFDYLTDAFEGTNMRHSRGFGQVILDEVDSMLIDNGGHIAKLATPFPGMESLRYIYIKIWQELHKAEKSYFEKAKEYIQSSFESSAIDDLMFEQTSDEMEDYITDRIKESDPTNLPLIPLHLRDYARSKLDVLIRNAIYAKYHCHEHQQYRLIVNDEGERVIAPVDYLNTGVTMNNTVWSNGLHQFVQLKHNLHLTSETLTSSFISNIGYIQKYEDKNIFGMTGTLGSRAEQELLSEIYNVSYAKIPTYKKKIFEEYPMLVVEDDEWCDRVLEEALKKVSIGRSVLVICETEKDLLDLNEKLTAMQKTARVYANEDNAKEPEEAVKVGDIIFATNIAGRGTNFRTEEDLEAHGGLHVCVGFLPCNLRVEEQAFGRTSRQGNKGSAQLVVRESEIDHLTIDELPHGEEIKMMRDLLESGRLEEIKNVLVKELMFKDELFGFFLRFYGEERKRKHRKHQKYVLDDLKEFWAFWLEKKDFKVDCIEKTSARAEFNRFCEDARDIIGGRICHNPYYCLALAQYYIRSDQRKVAFRVLEDAIEMSKDNNLNLLAGAYLKLFHICIADGGQIKHRIKKAIGQLFFISVRDNVEYKINATRFLQKAAEAIDQEITYIEGLTSEDTNLYTEEMLEQSEEENFFLKHFCSRLSCLKLHRNNIDNLIQQITQMPSVDFEGRTSTSEEQFQEVFANSQLNEVITPHELHEVQSIGIDTLFCLREVHDVPLTVIRAAQIQIAAGISALTIGLVFLPAYPIMSPIAATLISEGLLDIIFEVLSQGHQEFNKKSFMKSKFISYGISLLTFGLSAALQSKVILDKAIEYCQRLSKFLRSSTRFKKICEGLAKVVDKIQKYFEKLRLAVELKNLSRAEQLAKLQELSCSNPELFAKLECGTQLEKLKALEKAGKLQVTRAELLLDFTKKTATKIYKHPGFYNNVVRPVESQVFEKLFDAILKELRNAVDRNHDLKLRLRTSRREDINRAVDVVIQDGGFKTVMETVYSQLSLRLDVLPFGRVLTSAADIVTTMPMFLNYADNFAAELAKRLEHGTSNNNVDDVIEEVCRKMAAKMIASLKECYNKAKKIVATVRRIKFKKELIIRDIAEYAEGFLVEQIYSKIVDKLRTEMKKALEDSVRGLPDLMEKLRTAEAVTIFAEVDRFQRDHGVAQFKIAFEVLKSLEVVPLGKVASAGFSVTICSYKFVKCSNQFATHLEKALTSGDYNNKVDEIVDRVCSKMVDFLLPLLERVITGTIDIVKSVRKIDQIKIEDLIDNLPAIAVNMAEVLMYEFRGKFFELVTKLLVSGCKKLASLIDKLRTTPLDEINRQVDQLLAKDTVKILQLFYELYATLESMAKTKLLSGGLEMIFNSSGVAVYIGQFAFSLEKSLPGGHENNNTDQIVEDICSKLMKSVEPLLEQLFFQRNNPNFASESTFDKFSRVINLVWSLLRPKLVEAFKKELRRSIRTRQVLMEKLRTSYYKAIKKALSDTLKKSLIERLISKLVPELLVSLQKEFGKSGVTVLTLSFDITVQLEELGTYQANFARDLENALLGGQHDNDVDGIIDEIEAAMMKIIEPLLQKIYENTKNIISVTQDDSINFDDASIDAKKITTIVINEVEESVTNELVKVLDNKLRNKFNGNLTLKEKLRTNSAYQIKITVNGVISIERTKLLALLQELCQTLQYGSHDFKALFTAIRAGLDLTKFILFIDKFVLDLEAKLGLGNQDNYLEDVIFDVCQTISQFIQPLIKEVLTNTKTFAFQKKSLKTLPEVLDTTKRFVWKKISNRILEEFKNRLNTSIRERQSLMTKLQTTNRKFVVDAVRKILKKGLIERLFTKLVPEFLSLFEEELSKSFVVVVASTFKLTVDLNDIYSYVNHFVAQLDYALKGGHHNNNVDDVIADIESKLVNKVSPLLDNVYQQMANFSSAIFGKEENLTDINATLNTTVDIVVREVCASIVDQMVKMITETLKNFLKQNLSLESKLRTSVAAHIDSTVAGILAEDGIRTVVRGAVDEILKKCDAGLDESVATFLSQGIADLANIGHLIYRFGSELEKRLSGGGESNDVDEVVEVVCLDVALAVHGCLKELSRKMAGVVGSMDEVKKKKKMFVDELEKQLACLKTKMKS